MPNFGSLARDDKVPSDLVEGEQNARILKVSFPKNPQTGDYLYNEGGKTLSDVTFRLEGENAGAEVSRRYGLAFGQNQQTGEYAAFAQLIEAAVGIPCGDRKQRDLNEGALEGQEVRVVLKRVSKNGRQYTNVVNVLAPRGTRPKAPQPRQPIPSSQQDNELWEGPLDEIPF